MQYRLLGTRYKYNNLHSMPKYQPYNYASYGLLNKLLPDAVVNSDNTTTQTVILYLDEIFTRLMKYVDKIKYYRDWNRNPFN